MEIFFIAVGLLGGLALFLYGIKIASEALQKSSANRIKTIFSRVTKNRLQGVFFGVVFTFMLQGSTASTVLLVGFVSAGLMTFTSALAVILGAAIGSTLTVQLIAFKITDYALLFVILGVALNVFSKKNKKRYIGQVILGFGLVFYGMAVMSAAMEPLRHNIAFTNFVIDLAGKTLLLLLVGIIFTAIIQSSAATLALAMSLAASGVLSIEASIPLMLGANIGTTTTALLLTLTGSREAKRTALANFLFKFLGVLLLLPFISIFTDIVAASSSDVLRQIANAHTFFNIFITLIFLPFLHWFALLIFKILPEKAEEAFDDPTKTTKHIDESALEIPEIALWQTRNEIIEMANIIKDRMMSQLGVYFKMPGEEIMQNLEKTEHKIDRLYLALSDFITSLAQRDLHEEQSQEQVKYLYVINDLEHIGDILISIAREYKKNIENRIYLPEDDLKDFQDMLGEITKNYNKSFEAFINDDFHLAAEVIKRQPAVLKLEKDLRFHHFARMTREGKNFESSSLYLDMINDLLRINMHSVSISQTVIGMV